jgi:biopolymer transport protein ExbB
VIRPSNFQVRIVPILIASISLAFAGQSLAADAAQTLDELLQQTRNVRALKAKENAEREQEFLANREQQAALLAEAVAKRDAAEARSKALSAQFDQNELKLKDLQETRTQRVGSLGELFGVVRQVSGDVSSAIYSSIVSAQYPGRDEFFAKLAKAKNLPSMPVLEQLWFESQREMTESGRVVRFNGSVVDSDGKPVDAEVVRIGSFIATAGGKYASFLPSQKAIQVLPRQPGSELEAIAEELHATQNGYSEAVIDPSRGVLLALYVQRPTFSERIENGESINYVILLVGAIGLILWIYQTFYLVRVRAAVRKQLGNLDRPTKDNPLGRVLATFKGDASTVEEDAEVIELRISEAVLREVPPIERFQSFLRLAVAAGPLLGLIGTVIGMIITFQSITESGSSDPRLMAHGIGTAMIATVLGLGIAIPLLFGNAGLTAMSKSLIQILDEQSTGLLAESIERNRGQDALHR